MNDIESIPLFGSRTSNTALDTTRTFHFVGHIYFLQKYAK